MELRCKKCGGNLIKEDTMDTYGGIDEDYYIEHQLYSCEKCGIDYIVDKRIDIQESDIEITYFKEA